LAAILLPAQDIKEFEKKVYEFTLSNGLHFIVVERHESPIVSFDTYVKVGAANDPAGRTGVAQMLGRLAFKGTETVGTRNWQEEKKALTAIEEAFDRMDAERNKGIAADQSRVDMLRTQARLAIDTAQRGGIANAFLRAFTENGAAEPTAAVSATASEFLYSLPSNRTELWFLMESQRLLHPVFRDFYTERDASVDEAGQHDISNPIESLLGQLRANAFQAHPYRNPVSGWPGDRSNLRYGDAKAFFDRYYVPGNIVIAIVGDVNPPELKRMAERYFGSLPAKPLPPALRGEEPPQMGPRTVVVESPGPLLFSVAYKRPSQYDRDNPVYDALQLMLAQERTGLIYNELVREKHVAADARVLATLPDGGDPNLFAILLEPALGRTIEENQKALEEALQRFKTSPIDPQTLARAKAQGRATRLRRLTTNRELAGLLALHYANYGDWRKLFATLDDLNNVTAEQVSRVAERCFVATGRTTVYTTPPGRAERIQGGAK
jgi:predicted Zn-dependent peptidase